MTKRQILLLSSSNVYGFGYLEYAAQDIKEFLTKNKVRDILFIPYALKDYDNYLKRVKDVFLKWGFSVNGIHESDCPIAAVKSAKSVFVGGGNTFLLLKTLYDNKLVELLRSRVMDVGIPYIGTSAGTNVATKSICTTNDMPIVYPPSFTALDLVPFNINPHYLDHNPESKHKGETREERILQYLEIGTVKTVLCLREGGTLLVNGDSAILTGIIKAKLFQKGEIPKELEVGTDLSFLLKSAE